MKRYLAKVTQEGNSCLSSQNKGTVHHHGIGIWQEHEVKESSLFSMQFTLNKHISSQNFILFMCSMNTFMHVQLSVYSYRFTGAGTCVCVCLGRSVFDGGNLPISPIHFTCCYSGPVTEMEDFPSC